MGELEDLVKEENSEMLDKFLGDKVEFCLKNSDGDEIENGKLSITFFEDGKVHIDLAWDDELNLSEECVEFFNQVRTNLLSQYDESSIFEEQKVPVAPAENSDDDEVDGASAEEEGPNDFDDEEEDE